MRSAQKGHRRPKKAPTLFKWEHHHKSHFFGEVRLADDHFAGGEAGPSSTNTRGECSWP